MFKTFLTSAKDLSWGLQVVKGMLLATGVASGIIFFILKIYLRKVIIFTKFVSTI